MIGSPSFWENILTSYVSSIATAVTLALLGLGGYKLYQSNKKIFQKSESGSNYNIENKGTLNINASNGTQKDADENITNEFEEYKEDFLINIIEEKNENT